MMTSTRRATAQAFADVLQEALGETLVRVVLFGSVVRGEDHEDSDVDLLVVVKDEADLPDLSPLVGRWMVEHDDVLQVHVVSREAFEEIQQRGTSFARSIQREGEAIA